MLLVQNIRKINVGYCYVIFHKKFKSHVKSHKRTKAKIKP